MSVMSLRYPAFEESGPRDCAGTERFIMRLPIERNEKRVGLHLSKELSDQRCLRN